MSDKSELILPNTQFIETANGIQTIDQDLAKNLPSKNIIDIEEAFRLPHNVYLLNTASIILKANQSTILTFGFNSLKDAYGKSARDVISKNYAISLRNHDQLILDKQKMNILDEPVLRYDELLMNFLTIKMPWYNQSGKIIGIFGFSFLNGSTLEYAEYIARRIGLVKLAKNIKKYSAINEIKISNITLSPRQTQCLYFLIRGKSAKQIGEILSLSARTIETYTENLRRKLNCKSSSELIEKAIESNFQNIMYKRLKKLKI